MESPNDAAGLLYEDELPFRAIQPISEVRSRICPLRECPSPTGAAQFPEKTDLCIADSGFEQ